MDPYTTQPRTCISWNKHPIYRHWTNQNISPCMRKESLIHV